MVKVYKQNGDLIADARFVSPSKGLMFSKKLQSRKAVVMDVRNLPKLVIHMWFVFQKLDIALLDENLEIFQMKKNMKPFVSCLKPNKTPAYVLESSSLDLDVGEVLKIEKDI